MYPTRRILLASSEIGSNRGDDGERYGAADRNRDAGAVHDVVALSPFLRARRNLTLAAHHAGGISLGTFGRTVLFDGPYGFQVFTPSPCFQASQAQYPVFARSLSSGVAIGFRTGRRRS